MPVNRATFTPDGSNPPWPVVVTDTCTVPTEQMVYMLRELLGDCQDVLEIGTGSGYQTAVLAEKFRSVISIEINPLPEVARLLPGNVVLITANGYEYNTGETFDAVLVTFGTRTIADIWSSQVKEGGRLVVPILIGSSCRISVYVRTGTRMKLAYVAAYANFTAGANA